MQKLDTYIKRMFKLANDILNIQTDRYKPLATDIQTRFPSNNNTVIPVTKLPSIPDLSFPLQLTRDASFSLFNPYHSKMASRLIEVFMGWYIIIIIILFWNYKNLIVFGYCL